MPIPRHLHHSDIFHGSSIVIISYPKKFITGSSGKADIELFTPEAKAKLFPDLVQQIEETLNSFSLPVAVIYTNELIERREEINFRVFRYLLNNLTQSVSVKVKVTKDKKIAEIELGSK